MNKKDLIMLCHLRNNARIQLTEMSKLTGIPVSTLYERLTKQKFIKKFTAVPDFSMIGFSTRAYVLLSVRAKDKEDVKQFLMGHPHVNNLWRINNGYDFLFEGIFSNVKEVENLFDLLERQYGIRNKVTHYVIDSLKEHDFLSSPQAADWAYKR